MTVRARAEVRPWSDHVAVYLTRDIDGRRHIERPAPDGTSTTEPVEPGTTMQPSLLLPDDTGRALLDALTALYRPDTTVDARALRADRDREARRVDTLIDALIEAHRTSLDADKLRLQHLTEGTP